MKNFFILAFVIFLVGCKQDLRTPDVDQLVVAMGKSPERINPVIYPTSTAREVYQYIFTPLADYNEKTYELEPILINEIPEGRTILEGKYKGSQGYDLEIKEHAVWEDGSPITGFDYAFTLKAIKIPTSKASSYRGYLKAIEDVIVDSENPKKLRVILDEEYMLARETVVSIPIYPRYFYDEKNALDEVTIPSLNKKMEADSISQLDDVMAFANDFNSLEFSRTKIQGAGPYHLVEWIDDQTIILERKLNYWGLEEGISSLSANVEKLIFHIIPDQTAIVNQLKEGNVDMTKFLNSESFVDLKNNETYGADFNYFTPELFQYYFIGVNNNSLLLNTPQLRRAMAHLYDVDELIRILENGNASRTTGIFHPKKPYYNTQLSPIEYSPEKAQKILSEEGWEDTDGDRILDKMINGKKVDMVIDIYITGSALGKNIALFYQEAARPIGVKVEIVVKEMKTLRSDHLKTRDYDMAVLGVPQDIGLDDPYNKWHSDNDTPQNSNDYSYRSERADQLIELIRQQVTDKDRRLYYNELQEIMYEDQAGIFLYNPTERIVIRKEWEALVTSKRPGYMANVFRHKGVKVK